MILALDNNKWLKKLFSLTLGMSAILCLLSLILILDIELKTAFGNATIMVFIALAISLLVFILVLINLIRVKKIGTKLITFENNTFNDSSRFLNRKYQVPQSEIAAIEICEMSNRIPFAGIQNEYIIILKKAQKANSLTNQLNGQNIYVSDYLVDTDELSKLMAKLNCAISESA